MITLTTPRGITITGLNPISENDTQGVNTGFVVDFLANTVTFAFDIGSGAPGAFNIGVYNVRVTLTLNLTTGVWASTNGQSGTFSGAGFTNFVATMKSIRNMSESFAAGASNIMPGSAVAWA